MKILEKVLTISVASLCFQSHLEANHSGEANLQHYHEQTDFAIPPPQYPSHDEAMIFFINGAYTYWAPSQVGMDLLYTFTSASKPVNWVSTRMTAQSGFKAGLGINTFHDGWKVDAEYTWFNNTQGSYTPALDIPGVSYFCPWVMPDTGPIGTITSRFTNIFQRVDLTLDRTFYAGNYLAIAPWIGLVGAWETQNFNIELAPADADTPPTDAQIYVVKQNKQWWCIGPYAGLESSYYIVDSFGFYLSGGGSINISEHRTKKLETNKVTPTPTTTYTNTSSRICDIEPMLETNFGIVWDSFGIDWGISVQVGWELQVWFNHNTFFQASGNNDLLTLNNFSYYNYGNFGSYAMQGLTAKLRLNF